MAKKPLVLFFLKLQPNRYGKAAYKVVGFCVILHWWAIRDSNPRPSGYEPDALTN